MRLITRVKQLAQGIARPGPRARRQADTVYRGAGVVLQYDSVSNAQAAGFRRQMEWLRAHAYVLPLSELVDQGEAMSDRPRVALSFDGAFDSVHRNAVPILNELGLPATVFAVTGFLGRAPGSSVAKGDPAVHEIVMTVGQLASLRRDLFEVGSLTASHGRLDRLEIPQIRAELLNSKNDLSALLARPVRCLSVPYGAWNQHVVTLAGETGYDILGTHDPKDTLYDSHPAVVGRVRTSPDEWSRTFEQKVYGGQGRRGFSCDRTSVGKSGLEKRAAHPSPTVSATSV